MSSTKACKVSLPTELHDDILVRLPVKSLLRFRAVCKSWKALIDSISFKKNHLHFAQKNLSTLLLCRTINVRREGYRGDTNFKPSLHLLFPDTHQVSPSLGYDNFLEPSFYEEGTPLYFHPADLPKFGVANGLVLLCRNYCPVVWNPLSNEFRKIDPPPLYDLPVDCPVLSAEVFTFGFDPKTQDYKIVFIEFHGGFPPSDLRSKVTFQLYSLRNESWKSVSVRFPYVHSLVASDGYMNGKYYWFANECGSKDGSMGPPGIVSFDFTDETFEAIPLPESVVGKDWFPYEEVLVVTTRGCLELIKYFGDGGEGVRCEIWGMGDGGLWSRKLEVSLPYEVGVPLGVTKDGELVCSCLSRAHITEYRRGEISDVNFEQILLFNPNTGTFKNLGHRSSRNQVFTYVESLFSNI